MGSISALGRSLQVTREEHMQRGDITSFQTMFYMKKHEL